MAPRRRRLRFQRSQRTDDGLLPASAQRSQRTGDGLSQIARASTLSTKEPAASRPSDVASARDCPRAKLWAPTVAAAPSSGNLQLPALKSLQPWPRLWPNACSKSLQPSAPCQSLGACLEALTKTGARLAVSAIREHVQGQALEQGSWLRGPIQSVEGL